MDPALTVEKAKKTIRQKEAVQEQGQELGNAGKRSEVNGGTGEICSWAASIFSWTQEKA